MSVTTYQDFYGWEVGGAYGMALAGGSAAQMYINDGTANTGCYYGKALLRSAGGYTFTRLFSPSLQVVANTTCSVFGVASCWFRIDTAPDHDGTAIFEVGNGASATPADIVFRINQDLTAELYNNVALPTTVPVQTSGVTLPLPLHTWFIATIHFQWQRTAGVGDVVTAQVSYQEGSVPLTAGQATLSASFSSLLATTITMDRVSMGTLISFNAGTVTAGQVSVDDLVVILRGDSTTTTAFAQLPTAQGALESTTRRQIRLVYPIQQALTDEFGHPLTPWTGAVSDLQEIPLDESGPGQTSAVAGQISAFLHYNAYSYGWDPVPVQVSAIKVYGMCKGVGPSTEAVYLNGVQYPVSIAAAYQGGAQTPMVALFSTLAPLSLFDTALFGMVNVSGGALTLGACYIEVFVVTAIDFLPWAGCNGGSPGFGTDPSRYPPVIGEDTGCVLLFGSGSDSGGGSGCQPAGLTGADSGGGAGCVPNL